MMRAFIIGFPKAGTSSICRALNESGFKALHQGLNNRSIGGMLYRNFLDGADIFAGLQGYDAVTQPDVTYPSVGLVYWPQLNYAILRLIREQHPECRFILNTRDLDAHVRSIANWNDMRARLTAADLPGLPGNFGMKDLHLRRWIQSHYASVAEWGLPYAEVKIDAPDARFQLSEAVGCEIKWWGVENANPKLALAAE